MTDEAKRAVQVIGDVPAWADGWTRKAADAYTLALADLDAQDITAAVTAVLQTWRYMKTPPPAELRAAALEARRRRREAERQDAHDREYRLGKYREGP